MFMYYEHFWLGTIFDLAFPFNVLSKYSLVLENFGYEMTLQSSAWNFWL